MNWLRFSICLGIVSGLFHNSWACADEDSPRRTKTVQLIERCLPSVISLRVLRPHPRPGIFNVNFGTASVIHPDGYLLTNAHVVQGATGGEAIFADGRKLPFKTVLLAPQDDLALLKVNGKKPFPALPLGRSDDLMLGEPVVVIGTPDGLVHSVSRGIVSGLNRATHTEHAYLPSMIQTDAAVSGGVSGGPLINALGQQIGIITSRKKEAENVAFAISADHIRKRFPRIVSAEQRYGFQLGLQVDTLSDKPSVTSVAPETPAAKAGVKTGDVIRKINGKEIKSGVDFQLALLHRKAGEELAFKVQREKKLKDVSVTLGELSLPSPVNATETVAGLKCKVFEGKWKRIPEFSKLKPVEESIAKKISLQPAGKRKEFYGLTFTGLVKIPETGLYSFLLKSDDGSRLASGDNLILDNDGLHATKTIRGMRRLPAGLHPLEINFFQADGDQALEVQIQKLDHQGPQPKIEFFHQP